MKHSRCDGTLSRTVVKQMKRLVAEYDEVKAGRHGKFRFVTDFYKAYDLKRQNFLKYYHRFAHDSSDQSLLPRKRGPKWRSRRPYPYIEHKVQELRLRGLNRYEISSQLKAVLPTLAPSPSGVYAICKRLSLHRLRPSMKEQKRRIIKHRAGELGHVDCHYLPKGMFVSDPQKKYFLYALLDDCTRLTYVELLPDIGALTVMFATMRGTMFFEKQFGIRFEEIMSDNGPEFGGGASYRTDPMKSPFHRLLVEMGIVHRFTRPYRPQTNGKVERFWKTIEEDLLEDMVFDSPEHFYKELEDYLAYYTYARPHQALLGKTPHLFFQNLSSN